MKERGGVFGQFLFYPVYRLQELISAKPYFEIDLSEMKITERYQRVGGVLRNIFTSDEAFAGVLQLQKSAMNRLNSEQLRRIVSNDMESVHSFGDDQPKSSIMVYECYDPEFRNFSVTPASHYVLSEIRKIDAAFAWNFMISRGIPLGRNWLEVI